MSLSKNFFWGRLSSGFYLLASLLVCSCQTQAAIVKDKSLNGKDSVPKNENQDYKEYIDFFEKVYKTMEENYYQPVVREAFNKFVDKFNDRIYAQLKETGKTSNFIKWRSAAFLVDDLKDPEDTFSALYPPKPAQEYEKKVLGKKIDLGIEGKLLAKGYVVTNIEPRSDAYQKGLRLRDIIFTIDRKNINQFTEDQIKDLLMPLENTKVELGYVAFGSQEEQTISILSQEYFKQSVFLVPVKVPGVFCLQIKTFNRKTSEDMFNLLSLVERQGASSLILDLRGNPGGPPLAAREISSFFLSPGEDFAYFQKKGQPKALLSVPQIPQKYHYDGPIAILVDKQSGSASELFSGVLQDKGRAILIGTNTAGKVLLKSMFNFEDESMLLLVTARGHYPNGNVFSFNGLVPNQRMEDPNVNLIDFAAIYLTAQKHAKN